MPELIGLVGLDQFEKALRDLTEEVRGQMLRAAALKAVEPLVSKAASLAPRGTGALSRSMTAQSMAYAPVTDAIIRVGPGKPSGSHGILLEYGTVHMTKRPFLATAYSAVSQEILDRMELELAAILPSTDVSGVAEPIF